MPEIRSGYRVGPAEDPDQYLLEEEIDAGGEGQVWLASTPRRNGGKHRWAVKILHAGNLDVGHNESPADALERSYLRAQNARQETQQLQREVTGVVGATDVFPGPPPHPPGESGDVRTLYVISTWVEGQDLTKWLKHNPPFEQVCAVAAELAAIVDGIASSSVALVHRDISPGNVILAPHTDAVSLIDFSFAVPTHSGPVTVVRKDGYTAPEASRTGNGSPEADRYSFGAVIYYLLTGSNPPPDSAQQDCFDYLVRRSFPVEVAAHVTALLAPDPDQRPTSLVRWARELSELGAPTSTGLRYTDLDVTVDGFRTTTVTASANAVVARARLGPGALWALVADEQAPAAPVVVRSVADGTGNPVDFVIDKAERLMVGRAGIWQDGGRAAVGGGLAVVRTATGSATAYLVDAVSERLTTVELTLDGMIRRDSGGPYVRRVLAAATDHEGAAVVTANAANGDFVIIAGGSAKRLGLTDIRSSAVGLNLLGEPVCFVAAPARELLSFEQRYGEWVPTGPIEVPGDVIDVACVGQRDGVTIAAAGADGLWVTPRLDGARPDWQRLTESPCHRAALVVGAAWRLQLAALTDGQVLVATEDFSGRWSARALTR